MKVISPIFSSMRGKLGGAVGSVARGGIAYFRALVIPTNPSTTLQTLVRAAMQSASAYWRTTLSETNQELWWDQASGGQTGQGLFTKVNQPRVYAQNTGLARSNDTADPIDAIDYVVTPPDGTGTTITLPSAIVIDDSANTLTFTAGPDDEWNTETPVASKPSLLYVYGSHQQSPSRFSRQHPYRLLAVVERVNGDPAVGALISPIPLAPLGMTTTAGDVMYVKFRASTSDGRISNEVTTRVIITT